ncbi:MAG TPA: hypothetical protein VEO20_10535 [Thermoplasmata archaeon]|nr:hypothetical protein [Thermoplasmata archaeon]
MALLPDLTSAALYAVVVFLLVLGLLVIFVETISNRKLAAAFVGVLVVSVALAASGEVGLALLAVAVGGALIANHAFEWMTTR